jgi:cellobiose-specific phosphotransferase system component IIC
VQPLIGLCKVGGIGALVAGSIGILALAATIPTPDLYLEADRVLIALSDQRARVRYVIHFSLMALAAAVAIPGMYALHRRVLKPRIGPVSLLPFVLVSVGSLLLGSRTDEADSKPLLPEGGLRPDGGTESVHAVEMRGTFALCLIFMATFVFLYVLNWFLLTRLWSIGI